MVAEIGDKSSCNRIAGFHLEIWLKRARRAADARKKQGGPEAALRF